DNSSQQSRQEPNCSLESKEFRLSAKSFLGTALDMPDARAVEILHKPLELSTLQDVMQIRTDRTWDNGSCRGAKNTATTSVAHLTMGLTTPIAIRLNKLTLTSRSRVRQ